MLLRFWSIAKRNQKHDSRVDQEGGDFIKKIRQLREENRQIDRISKF